MERHIGQTIDLELPRREGAPEPDPNDPAGDEEGDPEEGSEDESEPDEELEEVDEMAAAAAAAQGRRKEINTHFTGVVEKFKRGLRNCPISDWLKRVDHAADYLTLTYAEKAVVILQYLPDDVRQEYMDIYAPNLPHAVPGNNAEENANWNYIKRSLKDIVDDTATQRENLNTLRTLRQGDQTVNEYLAVFKSYLKRTKKNHAYEQKDGDVVDEIVEIFIQGLDPDILISHGPYDSLEGVRDAAAEVMKYNNRRGKKEKPQEEKESEELKRLREFKRKQEEQFGIDGGAIGGASGGTGGAAGGGNQNPGYRGRGGRGRARGTRGRGRGRGGYGRGGYGHQGIVICYSCGIPGHISRDCPTNPYGAWQRTPAVPTLPMAPRIPAPALMTCEFCGNGHQTLQCPTLQKFMKLQAEGKLPEQHCQVVDQQFANRLRFASELTRSPELRRLVGAFMKEKEESKPKPYAEPNLESEEEEEDTPSEEINVNPEDLQEEEEEEGLPEVNVQRVSEKEYRSRTQRMGHAQITIETRPVGTCGFRIYSVINLFGLPTVISISSESDGSN